MYGSVGAGVCVWEGVGGGGSMDVRVCMGMSMGGLGCFRLYAWYAHVSWLRSS